MYNILRPAHSNFTVAILTMAGLLAMPGPVRAQSTTTGKAPAAGALPATIPIFPLPDVMLFPNLSVPLHIFEPRYRAMVADALKGDRIIGMALLRPGYEADYDRRPSIFPIGCAGVITEVEALPNGEYNIVLTAVAKFRITREEAGKPYRVALVTAVPEVLADKDKIPLSAQRQKLEAQLAASSGRSGVGRIPPGISDEEFVNGLAQYVDVDPLDRLQLLEREGVLSRAGALIDLLEKIVATPR